MEDRICEHCGVAFPFRKKEPNAPQRFCGHSCRSKYNAAHGIGNGRSRGTVDITCVTCAKVFTLTVGKANMGQRYCSPHCADEAKKLLTQGKRYNYKGGPYPMACEVCGTVRMVRHSLVHRYRACSKRCASELARRTWPRTSSLETTMLKAFADANIVVNPQFPIHYYTVDFAIPSAKLVIECDGLYWHSLPRQQWKDRAKDTFLANGGWHVIRLTESQIKDSPETCIQLVKDAVHNLTQ